MKTQLFTHVQIDAARDKQRQLRVAARTGRRGLYIMPNPKGKGWVYVVPEGVGDYTDLVVVSKPIATRDHARDEAKNRFGVPARQIKMVDEFACDAVDYRRGSDTHSVVVTEPHYHRKNQTINPVIDWLVSRVKPMLRGKGKKKSA